ncbi:glycosyltransferase family 2 protein [Longibacter salinarum]|nr:glycosyltransferase family 2 protein [Longibacter salinarum]
MNNDRLPHVSIGLPVFNGGAFIESAIESVLNQTFDDFELIISDNASTDDTESICRRYSRQNARIIYIRNDQNTGAASNFNQTLWRAKGKYFKWIAHDDVIEPTYLERCVEVLDTTPNAIICTSHTVEVNDDGQTEMHRLPSLLSHSRPHTRLYGHLCIAKHRCYQVFGLMRRRVLADAGGIPGYVESDQVLLAKLNLAGRTEIIDAPLFRARDHANRSIYIPIQERAPWFNPDLSQRRVSPKWRLFGEYIKAVVQAGYPQQETARCLLVVGIWATLRYPTLKREFLSLWSHYFGREMIDRVRQPKQRSAQEPERGSNSDSRREPLNIHASDGGSLSHLQTVMTAHRANDERSKQPSSD